MSTLPAQAFAAALSGLPRLTPARLRELLRRWPPAQAWQAVLDGDPVATPDPLPWLRGRGARPDDVAADWRAHARAHPPESMWVRCEQLGVKVTVLGDADYPMCLADDPASPSVLFSQGDLRTLDGTRCGVVGTRNATAVGRDMASILGVALARHGVRVVSGLARGVDAAAHRAALADGGAPVVGVVGSGHDVVYPAEHRELWASVAERGVLLSEVPPGTPAHAHHFPLRNRIIAALSDAVVVVESRAKGGSLHTAREAEQRGIPVLAVPGSPRNPAAEGTNLLIRDGATIVLDPVDVLVALGFQHPAPLRLAAEQRARPDPADRALLGLFADQPLDLEQVARRTELSLSAAALGLARLEAGGWLCRSGPWFERVSRP